MLPHRSRAVAYAFVCVGVRMLMSVHVHVGYMHKNIGYSIYYEDAVQVRKKCVECIGTDIGLYHLS